MLRRAFFDKRNELEYTYITTKRPNAQMLKRLNNIVSAFHRLSVSPFKHFNLLAKAWQKRQSQQLQ